MANVGIQPKKLGHCPRGIVSCLGPVILEWMREAHTQTEGPKQTHTKIETCHVDTW